jgi:4-hydroxy-3-methylbut-2-en-1-yl diphosphate synthase IspG/GcpE
MEIEALTAEVVRLKRELADAGTKAVACPECERRRHEVAQRVRKHRAKV